MAPEIPTHFATGDQGAQHLNGVDANQKGATDAFQKQVQETQFGFLNSMSFAMGGRGDSRPSEPAPVAPEKINPKDQAIQREAAAFGLANEGDTAKQDGAKIAENFRQIAFASVYDAAVNNPKNQSGMPGRGEGNSGSLDFKAAPHLNMQAGQPLRWAS
jgi:hypothetical protein